MSTADYRAVIDVLAPAHGFFQRWKTHLICT
jgi:hypothetical protein